MSNKTFIMNRIKRESFFDMPEAHFHEAYELYYLYSGTRKFFIHDTFYQVKKGDVILIAKGDLHRTTYLSNLPHERLYIYFSESYFNQLVSLYGREEILKCFAYPHSSIPSSRREYIENLLDKMFHEYMNPDNYSETLIQGYLNEFIIFLMRYQKYRALSTMEEINSEDALMQKAAKFIAAHFNQPITLDSVAQYVNMSSPYFSKKFKDTTGFGFKEYLISIRIKHASTLLLESTISVTDIAFQCGFNNSNYFGDLFKKVKGISPLQYRKFHELI